MPRLPRRRAGRRRRLPAALRAGLDQQRQRLLADAVLPVVPLDEFTGAAPAGLPAAFDVVGVASLAAAADPAAMLARVRAAMGPDGRLLLFEPYRRARWSGTLTDVVAPLVRRLTGFKVNLPVAALVREAGFVIGTIERVAMPSSIGPSWSFCRIVAYPVAPNGAGDAGIRVAADVPAGQVGR